MGSLMRRDGHLLRRSGHLQNSDDQECCCEGFVCCDMSEFLGTLMATFSGCPGFEGEHELPNCNPECTHCGTLVAQFGSYCTTFVSCGQTSLTICMCCDSDETGCQRVRLSVLVGNADFPDCAAVEAEVASISCSCDPFEMVFEVHFNDDCPCVCDPLTITVTEIA